MTPRYIIGNRGFFFLHIGRQKKRPDCLKTVMAPQHYLTSDYFLFLWLIFRFVLKAHTVLQPINGDTFKCKKKDWKSVEKPIGDQSIFTFNIVNDSTLIVLCSKKSKVSERRNPYLCAKWATLIQKKMPPDSRYLNRNNILSVSTPSIRFNQNFNKVTLILNSSKLGSAQWLDHRNHPCE